MTPDDLIIRMTDAVLNCEYDANSEHLCLKSTGTGPNVVAEMRARLSVVADEVCAKLDEAPGLAGEWIDARQHRQVRTQLDHWRNRAERAERELKTEQAVAARLVRQIQAVRLLQPIVSGPRGDLDGGYLRAEEVRTLLQPSSDPPAAAPPTPSDPPAAAPPTLFHTWMVDGAPAPWSSLMRLDGIAYVGPARLVRLMARPSGTRRCVVFIVGLLRCGSPPASSLDQLACAAEPADDASLDAGAWEAEQKRLTEAYQRIIIDAWMASVGASVLNPRALNPRAVPAP